MNQPAPPQPDVVFITLRNHLASNQQILSDYVQTAHQCFMQVVQSNRILDKMFKDVSAKLQEAEKKLRDMQEKYEPGPLLEEKEKEKQEVPNG